MSRKGKGEEVSRRNQITWKCCSSSSAEQGDPPWGPQPVVGLVNPRSLAGCAGGSHFGWHGHVVIGQMGLGKGQPEGLGAGSVLLPGSSGAARSNTGSADARIPASIPADTTASPPASALASPPQTGNARRPKTVTFISAPCPSLPTPPALLVWAGAESRGCLSCPAQPWGCPLPTATAPT